MESLLTAAMMWACTSGWDHLDEEQEVEDCGHEDADVSVANQGKQGRAHLLLAIPSSPAGIEWSE